MIQLKTPIARLVIKDLIIGDSSKEQLSILNTKIGLLENKIVLKDSIIFTLNAKTQNYKSIIYVKDTQLDMSRELSRNLQINLKKAKIKGKIIGSTGILIALGLVVILN